MEIVKGILYVDVQKEVGAPIIREMTAKLKKYGCIVEDAEIEFDCNANISGAVFKFKCADRKLNELIRLGEFDYAGSCMRFANCFDSLCDADSSCFFITDESKAKLQSVIKALMKAENELHDMVINKEDLSGIPSAEYTYKRLKDYADYVENQLQKIRTHLI